MSTSEVQKQLDAVTGHTSSGNWQGFRSVLLNAAHALGAEVNAGRMTRDEATMRLGIAIRVAGHVPNTDDRRWIAQGLEDACARPADSQEDLGKLVWATWKETDVPLPVDIRWESLPPSYKHVFAAIGKALYDAGFQAGADSVNHV